MIDEQINALQVFAYNGREVRTVIKDGEPWWVLKDVCDVLGLNDARRVAERLDEDERSLTPLVDVLGKRREMYAVNDSGLYNVIVRSDKPEAKAFKRWITHDVLPSIRKHGGYLSKRKAKTETARRKGLWSWGCSRSANGRLYSPMVRRGCALRPT